MRSTAIDRRRLLQFGGGTLLGLALPRELRAEPGDLYLSSTARPGGGFAAAVIDAVGKPLLTFPIEARGHDAARDPIRRRAILFARHPGRFALVIELEGSGPPSLFAPPPDRVFSGHGVFTTDGKLLYATESDAADGRGVLGVYETDGFRRVGEISTHGIGPHEVVLSRDGGRLIVANGGIATDPEIGGGRQNLNLAAMEPSLVELDLRSGGLLNKLVLGPELQPLSIRHLAFDASDAVWFGCQWEGDPVEHPPLVGRLDRSGAFRLIQLDRRPLLAARNYIGAMAASRDGSLIAASCPRGGVILAFDAATGRLVTEAPVNDGSGIAPADNRDFLASSGDGTLFRLAPDRPPRLLSRGEPRFDNHLRLV